MTGGEGLVIGFALATTLYFGLDVIARGLKSLNARLRAFIEKHARRALQLSTPAVPAATPAPALGTAPADDGWFSLPGGNRMEYRATGFAIELHPGNQAAPYHLLSPEGAVLASGPIVAHLKVWGIFAANERAQFEPGKQGGAA
jgi:hypothetical protein